MATITYFPTVSTGGGDAGTLTTLGADATGITFSSLSGDTDGDYEIEGELLLPLDGVNAAVVSLQPNALATNQTCRQGADGSYSDLTDLRVGGAQDGAGASLSFRIRIQSLSGRNRYYLASARRKVNTGPGFLVYTQQGVWTGTATIISSLVLSAAYAGAGGKGLLSGSYARIRKLGFTA